MKSHLSLILWSRRSTAKCSLLMFGTVLVKNGALRAASPAEKSFGGGILAHSAAMAGLRPSRADRGCHYRPAALCQSEDRYRCKGRSTRLDQASPLDSD